MSVKGGLSGGISRRGQSTLWGEQNQSMLHTHMKIA
jgi:hypothetical protein